LPASVAYIDSPTALHLRAMDMLFEGPRRRAPSSSSPAAPSTP
jgi:hypothetical protein